MSRRYRPPRIKHWSEYERPAGMPAAPDLYDVVDFRGHIHGPFPTRAAAEVEAARLTATTQAAAAAAS